MDPEPVELFYSYAHEDEPLRDELDKHLKIMERRRVIRSWHDRRITPGGQWDREIDLHLSQADLILLLVSADFISSDYIWGQELATAMKRHESGEASVVPVMLRAVDVDDAPFAKLQALPTDMRPVTSWPNRDEAWTDVAKGIRRTVLAIAARRPPAPPAPSMPAPAARAMVQSLPDFAEGASDAAAVPADFALAPDETSPPPTPDPLLDRVLSEFSDQVTQAAELHGADALDRPAAQRSAMTLIDVPGQTRVLWVDDHPSNNRFEVAALAKLQIEVAAVASTDEALARIAADPEPFDLVISDWHRSEPIGKAPSAGVRLLRELRSQGRNVPLVFYHGITGARRSKVHDIALREGAVGEAVTPGELFSSIAQALGRR